jgi:hypothetical protein
MAIPVHQDSGAGQADTGAFSVAWPTHQADDVGLLFTNQCDQGAPSVP